MEGGAGIGTPADRGAYIFHYTYGLEYTMAGRPQGFNQIGEWSLDKRHYGASYPPRHLKPPPATASTGTRWLLDAFNEASAGIPTWPETKALGTIGWRRVQGSGIDGSALAARLVGTRWTWAGIKHLEFLGKGQLKTPWGSGVWGIVAPDPSDAFCAAGCAFADFSGALHNVAFDFSKQPNTFSTFRVGDGENVPGVHVAV